MGLEDLVNKGKGLYAQNKDKVDDALKSDQAEDVSDRVLGGAADFAKKVLPDSVDGKVDEVRDKLDGSLGNDR
ncbi:Rv0909 family putative TA system antitoxin [Microbacterium betulae]|uniref:Rv0909 family putative TA system antitoxin n=1 Tax=Microbacterium betulae TaxID=2981139 RepID=A0AA97FET7_9MICO|nr:Rv0909 family putative TA system antitoxin [Microbacterium sp. AB]WOF22316.1 Rv0909 family putative TA system antitoxin [Microbacterium sp. AB]